MLTFNEYEGLSTVAGNSFYVYNDEIFRKNLQDLLGGFRSSYPNTDLCYALKANYMPQLIRSVLAEDCLAEVSSRLEYEIATRIMAGGRVVFNGPLKSPDDFLLALGNGSTVNIDSLCEIEHIRNAAKSISRGRVGLRVNFPLQGGASRFGLSVDNGDLRRAVEQLRGIPNIEIVALHSHVSSRDKSADQFKGRLVNMIDLYREFDLGPAAAINVGGGFFGNMPDHLKEKFPGEVTSFEEYGHVIAGTMHDHFGADGPCLIVEPGVSMVADAFDYVTRVIGIKRIGQEKVVLVDSSVNILHPTGFKSPLEFTQVTNREPMPSERCKIVGYTCMEHDILYDGFFGDLQVGDLLIYSNRGAYSLNYKPPFIRQAPPVIDRFGTVWKREETIEDILRTYSA